MSRILCIGDTMIKDLVIVSKNCHWEVQCYHNITAMTMADDHLFSFFLNEKKYDIIIFSFGTVDLMLNDSIQNVVNNVLYLYTIAKQITPKVIVMSSIKKFENYNLELFFRIGGQNLCNTLGNLSSKYLNGIYPNSRGRKRIAKRLKKMVDVFSTDFWEIK